MIQNDSSSLEPSQLPSSSGISGRAVFFADFGAALAGFRFAAFWGEGLGGSGAALGSSAFSSAAALRSALMAAARSKQAVCQPSNITGKSAELSRSFFFKDTSVTLSPVLSSCNS